jgi:hypothetical protein
MPVPVGERRTWSPGTALIPNPSPIAMGEGSPVVGVMMTPEVASTMPPTLAATSPSLIAMGEGLG